jgi:hypothetical protein
MRIAYFDCFSGCAGDMCLGALLDAGCGLDALRAAVSGLGLGRDFDLRLERTARGALAAAKAVVEVFPRRRNLVLMTEEPHPHRTLAEVQAILRGAGLAGRALERAERAFSLLAAAEAKVHGTSVEAVHFHEVGAIDAIVDIAGTCAALEILGVERVYASEPLLGRGTIRSAHGEFPAPGPAVLKILEGRPVRTSDIGHELTTPTGAALLAALAEERMGPIPPMRVLSSGYGAGDADFPGRANVLRVILGDLAERPAKAPPLPATRSEPRGAAERALLLLEANLDDATGQEVAVAIEALLAAGALDAFATPCVMKKGRPGVVLAAIAREEDRDALEAVFFRETPTFGVRRRALERTVLAREVVAVPTPYGPIEVKVGRGDDGRVRSATPEHESARRAADRSGVPVREALEAARAAARALREGSGGGGGGGANDPGRSGDIHPANPGGPSA